MFSRDEKTKIAAAVEKVLLDMDHPEMPKENVDFTLHVEGSKVWSWADIRPNWVYQGKSPETTDWNENARDYLKK